MQQPKLRFKTDNKNDFPNWEEKELGQILTEDLCPVKNPDNAYTKLSIRSHGKGTFDHYVVAGESLDVDKMFEVKANRLILNITFAWELAIAITTKKDEGKLVSHRFPQYKIDGDVNFYKYRFINERMQYDLGVASPGGAGRNRVLNKSDFLKIKKYIPSLPEQQKIASLFTEIDNLIKSSEKELEGYKEFKKGMLQKMFPKKGEKVPEVRFPGFDGEWEEHELIEMFKYEQPTKYIVEDSDYEGCSKYPVLTANKGFVLGYTNETNGVYDKGDVIIFDDFTCDHKFVNFPFKVKSSAIKFLTPNKSYDLQFLSKLLSSIDQKPLSHQRHWISVMQPTMALTPSFEEQQKIGSFFKSLDEEIELQKQKVELIKEYKKGLLQQMFV